MTILMTDYRLVPMVREEPQEVDPIHHTEAGDYNLCSYIEPFETDATIVDLRTGEEITYGGKHTIAVYVFWMGHPVQKHLLVSITEHGTPVDLYDYDDAVFHSQAIHDSFGNYMDGFESEFPKYRALGWAFLPASAIIAIGMAEHRAFTQASTEGNWDVERMYEYADFEPDDSPMVDKNAKPPVELVKGWEEFISTLKIYEEDETDDNDERRNNTD